MESHNHPSYIEPYQGAATGVGGILRDVFTMGARPVAAMNALRFGSPDHEKTRHLVSGVVAGVGGYGNSFGVPTVGGEVEFDERYNGNILRQRVRGGARATPTRFSTRRPRASACRSSTSGPRPDATGSAAPRMASAEFGDDIEEKRPTVQVGDPFTEKRLLEACLELDGDRRGDRHPGHGRGGPHLLGGRDGRQGRPRHRCSTSTTCRCAKTR